MAIRDASAKRTLTRLRSAVNQCCHRDHDARLHDASASRTPREHASRTTPLPSRIPHVTHTSSNTRINKPRAREAARVHTGCARAPSGPHFTDFHRCPSSNAGAALASVSLACCIRRGLSSGLFCSLGPHAFHQDEKRCASTLHHSLLNFSGGTLSLCSLLKGPVSRRYPGSVVWTRAFSGRLRE